MTKKPDKSREETAKITLSNMVQDLMIWGWTIENLDEKQRNDQAAHRALIAAAIEAQPRTDRYDFFIMSDSTIEQVIRLMGENNGYLWNVFKSTLIDAVFNDIAVNAKNTIEQAFLDILADTDRMKFIREGSSVDDALDREQEKDVKC